MRGEEEGDLTDAQKLAILSEYLRTTLEDIALAADVPVLEGGEPKANGNLVADILVKVAADKPRPRMAATRAMDGSAPTAEAIERGRQALKPYLSDAGTPHPLDCCADALYWCPTARQIECRIHGGFNTCCKRPEVHVPVAIEEERLAQAELSIDDEAERRVDDILTNAAAGLHVRLDEEIGRSRHEREAGTDV